MQTKIIFKIQSIIFSINGLGQLFFADIFFEMANMEITSSLVTLGQFLGASFIFLSILTWKTSNLTGEALKELGNTWALGCLIWTAIIGYHAGIGAAGGPIAIVNMGMFAVFGVLYFISSKK